MSERTDELAAIHNVSGGIMINLGGNKLNYADSEHVTTTESYDPDHQYHFTGQCHMGCRTFNVSVDGSELFFYRNTPSATLQSTLSNTPDEREWLNNGFCDECHDKLQKEGYIKKDGPQE